METAATAPHHSKVPPSPQPVHHLLTRHRPRSGTRGPHRPDASIAREADCHPAIRRSCYLLVRPIAARVPLATERPPRARAALRREALPAQGRSTPRESIAVPRLRAIPLPATIRKAHRRSPRVNDFPASQVPMRERSTCRVVPRQPANERRWHGRPHVAVGSRATVVRSRRSHRARCSRRRRPECFHRPRRSECHRRDRQISPNSPDPTC